MTKDSMIDRLVAKHTALYTMEDLTDRTQSNYRPSLQCNSTRGQDQSELRLIADRYDAVMSVRNDPRRAFRF